MEPMWKASCKPTGGLGMDCQGTDARGRHLREFFIVKTTPRLALAPSCKAGSPNSKTSTLDCTF